MVEYWLANFQPDAKGLLDVGSAAVQPPGRRVLDSPSQLYFHVFAVALAMAIFANGLCFLVPMSTSNAF